MSTRPITDSELKTLQSMADQGDLELSLKEITYRNRQCAQALPLLLEEIVTLRVKLERAEADTRLVDIRRFISGMLKGNVFDNNQWTKGYCAAIVSVLDHFDRIAAIAQSKEPV